MGVIVIKTLVSVSRNVILIWCLIHIFLQENVYFLTGIEHGANYILGAMKRIIISISFIILISCGEADKQNMPYSFTELALDENVIVEATNKNGAVLIEYISPLMRRYKWDKYDELRALIPRKERWMGLLGAYAPAEQNIWNIFSPRIVAEDSRLYFNNKTEMEKWLFQGKDVKDWVYTNDGLVVGFFKSPDRDQVNIEVYQLYVDGAKPTIMEGSRPKNIKITKKKHNGKLGSD